MTEVCDGVPSFGIGRVQFCRIFADAPFVGLDHRCELSGGLALQSLGVP